ncbi:hypothetical protein nrt1_58880 [Pseudomonas aeruginosa]
MQGLAGTLIQFYESVPGHGGAVVQFVLPIDSADIRALLVNPAAFEVVIEMPADTIATIQAGSFCQQMDTFAAFPALIAGKAEWAVSHGPAGSPGPVLGPRDLHCAPARLSRSRHEYLAACR